MSGVGGVKEKVSIPLLLEDLITMHAKEFERYSIHVTNEYEEIPEITLDRGKLLQILVNLIKNAIDSLKTKMDGQKTLAFRSKIKNKRTLCIKVMDNGSGIAHEDLVKIFSYGFTTKKEGHGFGLHHSALLAKEMNGQLNAESPGANRGALFTLTLPVEE